jgi:hypothetical protein
VVVAVLPKGADLSEVVPKAVDQVRVKAAVVKAKVGRAVKVARVAKAKTAVKAGKFIMGSPLLLLATLKVREMGPKEVHRRGANLSIKDLENRVIRAKASDLYRFSAK